MSVPFLNLDLLGGSHILRSLIVHFHAKRLSFHNPNVEQLARGSEALSIERVVLSELIKLGELVLPKSINGLECVCLILRHIDVPGLSELCELLALN